MKLIKRLLAEVHMFFASMCSVSTINVPAGAKSVMTPLGELDLTNPKSRLSKEHITWYGFRKAVSYWVYSNGSVGCHRVYNIVA